MQMALPMTHRCSSSRTISRISHFTIVSTVPGPARGEPPPPFHEYRMCVNSSFPSCVFFSAGLVSTHITGLIVGQTALEHPFEKRKVKILVVMPLLVHCGTDQMETQASERKIVLMAGVLLSYGLRGRCVHFPRSCYYVS
ncbi:hypothetical protein O3P69_003041 [Scylla paramamosain]|uniref:Uncharacterized protein n=1 Tax=Scylla paramamosain TaxID=85552 RepID=A0AAW0UJ16_SCYPA